MSDSTPAPAAPGKSWFKAVIGTLAGLMSGAAMMYVTPLVDRVIKPAKPIANFAVEVTGNKVVVQNRSTGNEGWLDFGDGTPLEAITSPTQSIPHSYAKPGTYTVKLSTRNFLGEDNERSVPVEVKAVETPQILALEAIPVSAQNYAPATFRLVGKAQNAETAIWDLGGERPLEINSETPNQIDRLVTFTQPGKYTVQLAVLNSKQADRRAIQIPVMAAPSNSLMGVLHTAEQGMKMDARTTVERIPLAPTSKAEPFERTLSALPGFSFTEAKLATPAPAGVDQVTVEMSKDRKQLVVRGQMQPLGAKTANAAQLVVPIGVRQERQQVASRAPAMSTIMLKVPGSTVVPFSSTPADWANVSRSLSLEIKDNSQTVWPLGPLPKSAIITWQGKKYQLSTAQANDKLQIDLQELRTPGTAALAPR